MLLQGCAYSNNRTEITDIIAEDVQFAIYLIDQYSTIRYANDNACQLLGYSRKELSVLTFSALAGQRQDPASQQRWWQMSIRCECSCFTTQHHHRNGEAIPVLVHCQRYDDRKERYLLCKVQDQRSQYGSDDLQYQHHSQMEKVVENSPDFISRFDLTLRCVYANASLRRCLGHRLSEISQWQFNESQAEEDVGNHFFSLIKQTLAEKHEAEKECSVHFKGVNRILHLRCLPEYDLSGQMVSVLAIGRDITGVRQAEAELRIAHQQLLLLARNQALKLEAEKKQLASDIHDELGQHLTSLRSRLSLLAIQTQEGDRPLGSQITHLTALVDSTIQVVRDVSTRLRPNVLNLGLIPALGWLCDEFRKSTDCRCVLIAPDEQTIQLNEDTLTAAFRVIQESLTNAARHANASNIWIFVKALSGKMMIEVLDNGCGFDVSSFRENACGLQGMKERGRILNGEVTINSQPGKGTRISLLFPLPSVTAKPHVPPAKVTQI